MHSNISIKKRICLPYKYLNSDLKGHILKYIKNNLQGDCTKEYGYITDIKCNENELEIIDHEISRISSDLLFTVSFKADTINPQKGDEVTGNVCMIYEDGIFVNVQDRLKILVPSSNLLEYEYDEDKNCFKNETSEINIGNEVKVLIEASMFNKRKINCFGSLKEM